MVRPAGQPALRAQQALPPWLQVRQAQRAVQAPMRRQQARMQVRTVQRTVQVQMAQGKMALSQPQRARERVPEQLSAPAPEQQPPRAVPKRQQVLQSARMQLG